MLKKAHTSITKLANNTSDKRKNARNRGER